MNDPAPPGRSRLAQVPFLRTIVLWVVILVLMSALLYYGPLAGGGPAPSIGDYLAQMAPTWILFVPVVVLFVVLRRFAGRNQRGLELMGSGDLARAAEVFRLLSRMPIGPRSVPRFNLGLTLLRLGDVRGAIEPLERVHARGARNLRAAAASVLSLAHALLSDPRRASQLASAARAGSGIQTGARLYLAAEAVIALRGGDAAGAVRRFDEGWRELEICTTADLVRALRIVRAFAVASAGGAETLVAELLAGARPCQPDEYAWLGAGWPELARFLEGNGFAAAA